MSLKPSEIEDIIAGSFGEMKDGNKFTVDYLNPFIAKMKEFRSQNQIEKEKQALLLLPDQSKSKPFLVCHSCGNDDETEFEKDEKMAQVTCRMCPAVCGERLIHDGEWKRRYEGQVDPGFHGSLPDFNFSSSYNLRTGAIIAVPGQANKQQAKELCLTREKVEMNLSNILNQSAREEKQTRDGYKDKMKEEIFEKMDNVADSTPLHSSIVEKAKTIFANYRTNEEHLTHKFEVAAACFILAFREILKDERISEFKEFKCRYCKLSFTLDRDRRFHQKKDCEERPKIDDDNNGDTSVSSSNVVSSSSSSSRAFNTSKRMKSSVIDQHH
jgi:hypothetical protein